jgi:outer membrane protein assembly factor BamC
MPMDPTIPKSCLRASAIAAACGLAAALAGSGCSTTDDMFAGDKVDYRSESKKTNPLEVPPDLTQLSRDSRYRTPQGGTVSASTVGAAPPAAAAAPVAVAGTGPAAGTAAPAVAAVAPAAVGQARIVRDGDERWLVVPITPEALWPQLRAFWTERGFTLDVDSPEAGIMETGWAENRAKLPTDLLRATIGKVFEGAWSTGLRDRFRTRVERGSSGTEVYITHRGVEEKLVSDLRSVDERTMWVGRPRDPSLEAEFLARLMVKLGAPETVARTAVATAPAATPQVRARPVTSENTAALEVDEGFDRAWRRVGVALDRTGFTVEDRDRAAGLYFVRYVDPATVSAEEPGFFGKLIGRESAKPAPVRLRVQVKGADAQRSVVAVQNAQGGPETSDMGKRIVNSLVAELK